MKVSAKAEYACLAMRHLAARPRGAAPARIREIADAEGIPETYLVQILQRLRGAGLVRSVRGSAGGYCLARPPRDVSVAEVLNAVEDAGEADRGAAMAGGDALGRVWREASEAAERVLRRTTLEDLLPLTAAGDWVI